MKRIVSKPIIIGLIATVIIGSAPTIGKTVAYLTDTEGAINTIGLAEQQAAAFMLATNSNAMIASDFDIATSSNAKKATDSNAERIDEIEDICNITIQRPADTQQRFHADMLALSHVGNHIRG